MDLTLTITPTLYNATGTSSYVITVKNNSGTTIKALNFCGNVNTGTQPNGSIRVDSSIWGSSGGYGLFISNNTGLINGATISVNATYDPSQQGTPQNMGILIVNASIDVNFNSQDYQQTFNTGSFTLPPPVAPFNQSGNYASLSTYIVATLLANLQTINIANIFDNELTDLKGYPAATLTPQELQGKVLDNTRNERIRRFVLRVFIDRNTQGFGVSKAETILRSVADEITLKIDADPTMGGNCIDTVPFPARFGYINRANNNIRVMEITLDCRDAVTWR